MHFEIPFPVRTQILTEHFYISAYSEVNGRRMVDHLKILLLQEQSSYTHSRKKVSESICSINLILYDGDISMIAKMFFSL